MRKREKEWVSFGASGKKKNGDWTESEEAQMSQRKCKEAWSAQVHTGWLIFDGWYVRFICFSHQIHMTNTDDGRTFSAPAGWPKAKLLASSWVFLPAVRLICSCMSCGGERGAITAHQTLKLQVTSSLNTYSDGDIKTPVWFYASRANVTNVNTVKHTQTNLFYMFPST